MGNKNIKKEIKKPKKSDSKSPNTTKSIVQQPELIKKMKKGM